MEENGLASRRRAACEECRKRKLKCSGEPQGCSRCIKHNLACIYSSQKQMGRPRKQKTLSATSGTPPTTLLNDSSRSSRSSPAGDGSMPDLSCGDFISPDLWMSFLQTYQPPPEPPIVGRIPSQSEIATHLPALARNTQQTSMPMDNSMYDMNSMSSFDHSFSIPDNTGFEMPGMPLTSPTADYPSPFPSANTSAATTACPCLPNLYLSISTLSSIQAQAPSTATLQTLQSATCVARAAVYCRSCLTTFQTGTQNIMMTGTLLASLADGWLRFLETPGYDLWTTFSCSTSFHPQPGGRIWDDREEPYWRLWARQVVFRNVFGVNAPSSTVNPSTNNQSLMDPENKIELTLLSVVDAMERRQKMRHGEVPQTDEFAEKPSFGNHLDRMADMINKETEERKKLQQRQRQQQQQPQQQPLQNGGHGHGNTNGHVHEMGHGDGNHGHSHGSGGEPVNHFCISITHNVRRIMDTMAKVMGVPQLTETGHT